jgi:hypothetical protein
MSENLQQIKAQATASELAELEIAENGKDTALDAYKLKPGKQTKDNMDAARAFYDETVARLNQKYLPAAPEEEQEQLGGERFASRKQALDWLRGQGFKISTGKFYQDCDKGFPALARDKSVSKYHVLLYGQQLDAAPNHVAAGQYADTGENDSRKAKADADMAEMKATKMRREEDKFWLHADDAWAITAGLIGTLRDCIRHHLFTAQAEIVLQAAGDQDRSQEVFELTDEVISRAFNEVAGESINVVFEKEGE